jgi:hypothetical protein
MEATENPFTEQSQAPKRPQFLTVLCVLSFIMCGLGLLGGIYNLVSRTPEKMAEGVEKMREFSPEMADQMEQQMIAMQDSSWMKVEPYLNLIFVLVSLLGVIMMWNLNKKGFYIYIVGELWAYIALLIGGKAAMDMMGSMGGMVQGAAMMMMVLMFILDAAFIVMYAMNLKHMK